MLIHIGGWTGHRAEIVIAGTDPQKRRKKICKVHQEVADEDAFTTDWFYQLPTSTRRASL